MPPKAHKWRSSRASSKRSEGQVLAPRENTTLAVSPEERTVPQASLCRELDLEPRRGGKHRHSRTSRGAQADGDVVGALIVADLARLQQHRRHLLQVGSVRILVAWGDGPVEVEH